MHLNKIIILYLYDIMMKQLSNFYFIDNNMKFNIIINYLAKLIYLHQNHHIFLFLHFNFDEYLYLAKFFLSFNM